MTTLTWVLGGGLLGSHVRRAVPVALADAVTSGVESRRFAWHDSARLHRELADAAADFVGEAASGGHQAYALLWCAGAGVIATPATELARERDAFAALLGALEPAILGFGRGGPRGLFFLASSAGGVYAGNPERPLTERSRCVPSSAYGETKVAQEGMLAEWAPRVGVATLVGRITNLYGPGQNLDKPQGLLSQLVRALLYHQPLHVYVPLDTLRDYIYVADCARLIAHGCARLRREALAAGGDDVPRVTKILSGRRATSIAELIGEIKKIARQQPRLVFGPSPRGATQPADLRFRSLVWPELDGLATTPLSVGVERVYRDHLARYQAGRLRRAPRA